jgi:O-acetylhomoserine (thiol)-lyase
MGALTAAIFGLIFGAGLVISGMTDPNRILAFLDVAGNWDPSLALVMAAAIAIALPAFALARQAKTAALGDPIDLPDRKRPITLSLVLGAAIFGVGWGLSGLCPGPAIVLLSTGQTKALAFFVAVAAGIWAAAPITSQKRKEAPARQPSNPVTQEENLASKTRHPETLALHGGWRSDPATNAVAVPIYQTTSYQFRDAEHAANLFALKELGNIYTRIMNPTNDALEKRITEIEGGVGALAVSSGQAASAFAIQNLARAGDNIVSSTDLYGGTWNLFANTLKDQGIEVRFVDPADPENFRRATDERTRAYYAETLPNPKLTVFPIAEVAAIGRPLGIPLIIDNTAAPILTRPFEHGAAIIVYSTTKYIGGHGTSIGGLLVDSGNFDWGAHPARQPALNTPDPSYHGAVWTEAVKPLGPIAYIIKARVTLLRDLGSALSPFNAFLIIQGLETVPLRIERHSQNAQAVVEYLKTRPEVTRVIHPSVQTGVFRERADKYLKGGYGGLVGFELAGGKEAGRRFIDALQLFYHVANIGDARSLAIHPATTTHSQLSPAEQEATGVSDGYVRLSVGIEHIDDILADLDRGLAAASSPKIAKAA